MKEPEIHPRRLARQSLIMALIIMSGISALFIYRSVLKKDESFLAYHDKDYYAPLNDPETGFYGKVNLILQRALSDYREGEEDNILNLNQYYNRLKFYIPADSANYYAKKSDIRLIEFIPDSDTDEKHFYMNSYFADIIEKQRKNLWKRYFIIDFKEDNTIGSIRLDTTLFSTRFKRSSWEGEIVYSDPYKDVDEGIIYINTESIQIPLFTNQNMSWRSFRQGDDFPIVYRIRESIPENDPVTSIVEDPAKQVVLQRKESNVTIIFEADEVLGNKTEHGIRLCNKDSILFIAYTHPDSVYELNSGGIPVKLQGDRFDPDLPVCSLKLTRPQHKLIFRTRKADYYIDVTRNSPATVASRPTLGAADLPRISEDGTISDLFSKQLVYFLEQNVSPALTSKIRLAINPVLSKYLERELTHYVNSLSVLTPRDEIEMGICLIDISTGKIISAPYYTTDFRRGNVHMRDQDVKNTNLKRHYPGSSFKPLLTLAAWLRYPSLRNFVLSINQPTTYGKPEERKFSLIGYPVHTSQFGSDGNHLYDRFWQPQRVDALTYLSSSHDLYPVTLTMLSLMDEDSKSDQILSNNAGPDYNAIVNDLAKLNNYENTKHLDIIRNNNTPIDTRFKYFFRSDFMELLDILFSLRKTANYSGKDEEYSTALWTQQLYNEMKYCDVLMPDYSTLHAELIGNNAEQNVGSDLSTLKAWVLGLGVGEITNIDLAVAYARLISGNEIKPTYINDDLVSSKILIGNSELINGYMRGYNADGSRVSAEEVWNDFLNLFVSAQSAGNLLPPARIRFEQAAMELQNDSILMNSVLLFGKTGTPDDYKRREREWLTTIGNRNGEVFSFYDEGVYAFAICPEPENGLSLNRMTKGVAGAVFIRRKTSRSIVGGGGPITSATARDFLTSDVFRNILFFNLKRLSR